MRAGKTPRIIEAMATLGEQIRDALDRRHMDQADLAALMDVSVRAVNDWVNDRARPRNRMGALKAWAPELAGGEQEPWELEILALTTISESEKAAWIEHLKRERASAHPARERAS